MRNLTPEALWNSRRSNPIFPQTARKTPPHLDSAASAGLVPFQLVEAKSRMENGGNGVVFRVRVYCKIVGAVLGCLRSPRTGRSEAKGFSKGPQQFHRRWT